VKAAAMVKKRISLILPCRQDLNEKNYLHIYQEFALELADCYGCLFDMRYEDLNTGKLKMTPESVFECNQWASLSIENA
jgi:hypothetical protein